jgi:hypothetical protein
MIFFLESSQAVPLSGIIQAFEHNNSYTKNKYTDNYSYDENGDNDDELEENVFLLTRIYVSYNCIANSSDELSIILLL